MILFSRFFHFNSGALHMLNYKIHFIAKYMTLQQIKYNLDKYYITARAAAILYCQGQKQIYKSLICINRQNFEDTNLQFEAIVSRYFNLTSLKTSSYVNGSFSLMKFLRFAIPVVSQGNPTQDKPILLPFLKLEKVKSPSYYIQYRYL